MADIEGTFHPLTPPFTPGPLGEPQNFGGGLHSMYFEEEITLNTAGAATISNITLPIGSLVACVTARITEAITGAPDNWAVGVETETSKFITVQTTLTEGFTVTGNKAFDPSLGSAALGPITGAHNIVRITQTGAQITGGKIRVGIGGFVFKPFVS